jgi:hypothetical protein
LKTDFSGPEKRHQILQPPGDGLQAGALKPPDPVGMPWGRTAPADISFCTSPQLQAGQSGAGSSAEKTSCSNWWQQALHWYSKIGIVVPLLYFQLQYNNGRAAQVKTIFIGICP